MRIIAAPGLLPLRVAGPTDGVPVVLLHGFLADSRSWLPLTRALRHLPVRWLLPDLPGHGRAATLFPPSADWLALSQLLAATLRPHLGQPPLLGGYSMGGRIAAVLAASAQLPCAALWLESAHPPLPPAAALERQREDEARARALLQDGVPAFVDAWQALPLFASQRRLPPAMWRAQRRLRLRQQAGGLAQNLRWYGTGAMPANLHVPVPTHLLAGADDAKLCARAPAWQPLVAELRVTVVPHAGHAVHLEQPQAVAGHLAQAIAATFPELS